MGQWFGGKTVPMTGVAAVGVAAAARGRGAAHTLMTRSVNELHDRGIALSALYPATHTLYRKSGYERAGGYYAIRLDAEDVLLRDRALALRPLGPGDETAVRETYRASASGRNGALDRGPYIWDRVTEPRGERARGYGVFDGEHLAGYLYLLQRRREESGYDLLLTDFVYRTPAAARRLLTFLGDHHSLAREIRWFGEPADVAVHLLPEPRVRVELRYVWMLRLTHVPAALAARGYPAGLETELHLAVRDEIVPGNAGNIVLRVADGTGEVVPGGSGALELDVRALAALYSGFLSPTALRLAGAIAGDEAHLRRASAIFAGPAPMMTDLF